MDLKTLKAKVHLVACDARNLSRIVDSEAFERAWVAATQAQKDELVQFVQGIDKPKVDQWIKKVLANINLEDKSYRDLRELAKAAGIPYYNNKTKEQLLEELRP